MSALNHLVRAVTRSPIEWGLLACAAFYGLIFGGPLDVPVIHRYCDHHPVEYGEVLLFCIAMAALMLRVAEIATQRLALGKSPWKSIDAGQLPLDELCRTLHAELDRQPAHRQDDYYLGRLRAAVYYVLRLGSTEGLGDELKYLADRDATLAHSRYGLFRLIVWAIPILGFLGV